MIVAQLTAEEYVDNVLHRVRARLVDQVERLSARGTTLPDPRELADLLGGNIPGAGPAELDPHFADVGPFYDSAGAIRQLGGITKQALDSRRTNQTILAMRTGDGHWLYPAWQFTGRDGLHPVLAPVLRALRGLDRWAAGIWLVTGHPDLGGQTPREALRHGTEPEAVARLALRDKTSLAA